jgi:arginine/lysine/ornithine decarboxylase
MPDSPRDALWGELPLLVPIFRWIMPFQLGRSRECLLQARALLAEIRRLYKRDKTGMMHMEYLSPEVVVTPQQAFYANTESLPIPQSAGHICAESVMCYPPGIPILAPGERITPEIIRYIRYMKERGGSLTGLEDIGNERINVLKGGIHAADVH